MTAAESENGDEVGYSLVMPFVCVQSVGGPYDDDAFTAGWACGEISRALALDAPDESYAVRAASLEQLDLVAMRFGWVMTHEGWDDEWTTVRFSRPDPVAGSVSKDPT